MLLRLVCHSFWLGGFCARWGDAVQPTNRISLDAGSGIRQDLCLVSPFAVTASTGWLRSGLQVGRWYAQDQLAQSYMPL